MKKYFRLFATFLASTMFLLAVVGAAHAYNRTQALTKAAQEQRSDCVGNPLYDCESAAVVIPTCISTGINRVGHTQWVCGGVFHRRSRITSRHQYCYSLYDLSPFGRVLNYPTYKCESNIN